MKSTHQPDLIQRSAMAKSTIQQQPRGSNRMKNLDTHHCITIKWSPHSACRVGLTAVGPSFGAAPDGAAGALCGDELEAVQPPAEGSLGARRGGGRGMAGDRS
jgi:hypothetical protein